MKVSEQWLREWVNPEITLDKLGHQLTMAGLELDGVEAAAAEFNGVLIGEIISVEQHPDAERLKVCQVNIATEDNIQIVTNVASVTTGMKVPVATIGAILPGETADKPFKIKKTKLRGVLSQGMFCGADTLGIPDGSDGLLAIPENAPVGMDIREFMSLDDQIMEIDLTPNRADCLSIEGIAREVGVLTQTTLTTLNIEPTPVDSDATFPIKITADQACQRYAGRVISDVNVSAVTPLWMKEKLRRAGLRSLSPVVDITNFVLMELGQPMHAFDLQTLNQGIEVRLSEAGETLTLLDGQEITLDADTLVITDKNHPVALAGIMGGLDTAVSDSTTNIFLESAYFTPQSIAGRARRYGLHTDSSHRFERGVSPDLQTRAIERATQLILDICGGKAGNIVDQSTQESLTKRPAIKLRRNRISRVLGIQISDERVTDILQRSECKVTPTDDGWSIEPPAFRFDLSIEADFVEEIARIHGYDNIPASSRSYTPRITIPQESEVTLDRLRLSLIERGYQEAVTFSFVDTESESLLMPAQNQIKLSNPISSDLEVMRSTLWSGLLKAVSNNLNRQQNRIRLFETGLTFVRNEKDTSIEQRKKIAGIISGNLNKEQWATTAQPVDFYDLKGDVETLLTEANQDKHHFVPVNHPALHPRQSARIVTQEESIGWIGALHPRIQQKLGLSQKVFLFELDLEKISHKKIPAYQKSSRFPANRRDLALLVEDKVMASAIENALKKADIEQLVDYTIFDIYKGEGVEKGKKSIALSLILQDFSRTLEESEIGSYVNQVVELLNQETGATLRQ